MLFVPQKLPARLEAERHVSPGIPAVSLGGKDEILPLRMVFDGIVTGNDKSHCRSLHAPHGTESVQPERRKTGLVYAKAHIRHLTGVGSPSNATAAIVRHKLAERPDDVFLNVVVYVDTFDPARVAVGLYFLLKPYLGTETVSWVCILGAAPFAALGFVKYNGMTAEKFIWVWIKSEFLMPKKLVFHSTNTYYELMKPTIEQKQKEAYKNND